MTLIDAFDLIFSHFFDECRALQVKELRGFGDHTARCFERESYQVLLLNLVTNA